MRLSDNAAAILKVRNQDVNAKSSAVSLMCDDMTPYEASEHVNWLMLLATQSSQFQSWNKETQREMMHFSRLIRAVLIDLSTEQL